MKLKYKITDVALGVPKLFQLPITHRFQSAAVYHDAWHDAYSVLKGKVGIEHFLKPKYPLGYKDIVEFEIERFQIYVIKYKDTNVAYRKYSEFADRRFKQMMDRLARNSWERFQAEVFYKLVKVYTKLKF